MPTITFLPSNTTVEVKPGTTVFAAAAKAELAIPSQCGGKGACALCRVCVTTAQPPVSPMDWDEEGHLGNAFFITRERLSCRLQVFGDVEIEVREAPEKDKKARYIPYSIIRKREQMEREDDQRRATAKEGGSREGRGGGRRGQGRPHAKGRGKGRPPHRGKGSHPEAKGRPKRRRGKKPMGSKKPTPNE